MVRYGCLVRWRSGNAGVCKTSMRGFDSRPHLIFLAFPACLGTVKYWRARNLSLARRFEDPPVGGSQALLIPARTSYFSNCNPSYCKSVYLLINQIKSTPAKKDTTGQESTGVASAVCQTPLQIRTTPIVPIIPKSSLCRASLRVKRVLIYLNCRLDNLPFVIKDSKDSFLYSERIFCSAASILFSSLWIFSSACSILFVSANISPSFSAILFNSLLDFITFILT